MMLTALDVVVLLAIGGAAILGFMRGFVTEVLALLTWLLIVVMLKILHTPATELLTPWIGTIQGAAVLSFAIIGGLTYITGRMVANAVGDSTRSSILGPIDRVLGFGFGLVKGLILASLGFLLIALVIDTVGGGPAQRPQWMTLSSSYPLLNATSASIADFVDRRRRGEPVFDEAPDNAIDNATEAEAPVARPKQKSKH